jgi:hypothetical protein
LYVDGPRSPVDCHIVLAEGGRSTGDCHDCPGVPELAEQFTAALLRLTIQLWRYEMVKKRPAPTVGIRFTEDEKSLLDAYARATVQTRSSVVHELLKDALPHMAAVIVRADIARDLADPHVGDWTNTLPDAAQDKAIQERKAAQKEV